jgi:hypothetical protein
MSLKLRIAKVDVLAANEFSAEATHASSKRASTDFSPGCSLMNALFVTAALQACWRSFFDGQNYCLCIKYAKPS